jgi:phosphopantothenoylcysteine decarboxylase/phosphopantothenate--cysteine ligase
MGIAIADAAYEYGADVVLVLGPVDLRPKHRSISVVNVTTARSMAEECITRFPESDIAILAAAVADYAPSEISEKKLKRGAGEMIIKLNRTEDIASILGRTKTEKQIVAGFALETDNEIENAKEKLRRKNLDLIILNSLRDKNSGFGHDTNRITIIDKNNFIDKFELKSKNEAARDILDKIVAMLKNQNL